MININTKQLLSFLSLATLVTAMGFACSSDFNPIGMDNISSANGGPLTPEDNGGDFLDNGNLVVIAGQKTLGVSRYGQVLRNMEAQTGVELASGSVNNIYVNKATSFSQTGLTNTITAPYLLSVMTLGGGICDQLINEEKNMATSTDRRVFLSFRDFDNDGDLTETDLTDVIVRQGRNFWGKNPTAEQINILLAGVNESLNAEQDNGNRKENAALFLCTTMIASTDAFTN